MSPKERAKELAFELKKLLEKNLLKDSKETSPAAEKIQAIHKELNEMGFMAKWKANLDLVTLKFSVDVFIWIPKANMTPEEQKIYDNWFSRVNNLQPPN